MKVRRRGTKAQRHRGTEAQRHRGTKAQRHKVTKAQRHRGTKAQRHKGTKAQRHKGTEAQRHKGTEAQSDKGTEAQRHKVTKAQRHRGMKTYKDLIVWQKSMDLVTEIYKITKTFPQEEKYGLISQIRRSAVSVPSNIAEGYGRSSADDYLRFLQISISSIYEMQTQIEIAYNLKYLSNEMFQSLYESTREIERMMSSLIKKIKG